MAQKTQEIHTALIDFIRSHPRCSSKEIHKGTGEKWGYATENRAIRTLLDKNWIVASGTWKATKYEVSLSHKMLFPIDPEEYFQKEIDEREISADFNVSLISGPLQGIPLFTDKELEHLAQLQATFTGRTEALSPEESRIRAKLRGFSPVLMGAISGFILFF